MKLYVGNLSFQTTENILQDHFAAFGTVTDVHLVQDRMTGRSRGFAFVTMSAADEGQRAIEALHGKPLEGRNLIVNEARPKEDRPPRQDYGGGGGGGGGRRDFRGGGGGGDHRGGKGGGFRPRH